MRKSLAIAALVAVGGAATGAGATTLPQFLGSDTLFNVTQDALAACSGAAGLTYLGTGSGNGEANMIANNQDLAPMSRFINNNVCASPLTAAAGLSSQSTATGMAISLDGIVIAASASSGGVCNGTDTGVCSPVPGGAAYSTTVSGYTFSNWKDVLSIIYGGKSHETAAQIIANSGVNSGCGSTLRATIANNWGSLFQTACGASGSDGCTQLQHAFRRDDGSGTSDAMQSLLGLSPSPVSESNYNFGTSPFCNVNEAGVATATAASPIQITTTIGHHLTSGQTVQVVGVGENIDASPITGATVATEGNLAANGAWFVKVIDALNFTLYQDAAFTMPVDGTVSGNGSKVGNYAMVLLPPPAGLLADYVPTNYRDLDPVRRPCANDGSPTLNLEDVCGRDNQLGLVLPMVPTDFLPSLEAQYPGATSGTHCGGGTNQAVKTAQLVDPTTGLNVLANCPNGDTPHGGNLCVMPAAGGTNTECFAGPSDKPFVFNTKTGLSPAPGQVLGTIYNSRLLASNKTFQVDTFGVPIVGAWYRIHQVDAIAGSTASIASGANVNGGTGPNPVAPGFCTQSDATLQIGCLVQASPCSIGYAGRTLLAWNSPSSSNNVPLEINEQFPDVSCIQTFAYPLSRKLYLDSTPGFSALSAETGANQKAEFALAKCEASTSVIDSIITKENFINFASGTLPNNGAPFAEDYNESMLCPVSGAPADVNTNTIPGNPAGIPTVGTTCGNGIKEAYEDCDDGTTGATTAAGFSASYVPNATAPGTANGGNGGSGSSCSNTCRWTNAGLSLDTAGTKDVGGTACTAADSGVNCHTSGGVPGKCQNPATFNLTGSPGCLP